MRNEKLVDDILAYIFNAQPRDKDGKFASGPGGGGSSPKAKITFVDRGRGRFAEKVYVVKDGEKVLAKTPSLKKAKKVKKEFDEQGM